MYHDVDAWAAVPANNGGSGPSWQWNNELLVGFTRGTFYQARVGHQCCYDRPFESWLARSMDGGESWIAWRPDNYVGNLDPSSAREAMGAPDFTSNGFALRVEGAGYHGNEAAQWFSSCDRGISWHGPFDFTGLFDHPELADKQFTGRTAYIVDGQHEMLLFLTVRMRSCNRDLRVVLKEKTFLARTNNGGRNFEFVSWLAPWDEPYRAAMPAPVRLSKLQLVAALRRKSPDHNWIDCFRSDNNGASWAFLSKIGDTEIKNAFNGNPPALIRLHDGRLCAAYGNRTDQRIIARYSSDDGMTWSELQVLRSGFQSTNGFPDLGYVRLFQRADKRLIAVYFWCNAKHPETHIESTVFDAC